MAQKLMIYFSAVDLNMEIMKMVQRTSLPKSNHTHLAEVFLSGLLKRHDTNKNLFDFKEGVREILLDRLYPYKIKEIREKNAEFIRKNNGSINSFSAIKKSPDTMGEIDISKTSKSFAHSRGEDIMIDKVTEESIEYKSKMKNEIIIYSEKDIDVNLISIVNYLNKICTYFTFKVGKEPFELDEKIVNKATSYKNLNSAINQEIEGSLGSFFFTKKPYNNNYFFDGNTNLMIVSFSGWSSLSSLPYSNAIAYFIAEILSLDLSSYQHRNESIGCLYDFLSNKSDIDKNMREAYICKDCSNRIEDNKSDVNMKVLKDIESILEVVGRASVDDLDILENKAFNLKKDITLSCDEVIKYTVEVKYKESKGSGFILKLDNIPNSFFVITAKHIFVNDFNSSNDNIVIDEVLISYKSEVIVPKQIILLEADMIAFVFDNSVSNTIDNLNTIPLASNPNQFKESIFAGYSIGNNLICQKCIYSHKLEEKNLYQITSNREYDINYISGVGGSGLFIQENGHYSVVGMIVQYEEMVSAFRYVALAPYIEEIIDRVKLLQKKYLTFIPPINSKFIGREAELKEIDNLLNSSNSLLLINGIGGIGKSTIASYYLHSQKDKFDYYGFFKGVESFVNELRMPLDLKQEQQQEAFMEALIKLRQLEGEKLLVIDDVRDIEENQENIERILELTNSGYKILLTSREEIEDVEQYYLDVLSIEDAKKLFNSIYKVEDEALLEEILKYLDCHAFFVEMTAKTLKSKKTLTPEMIKEKFKNGEFSNIKRKRKESFSDYLNNLFSFDELDDEEILILKQFSVLPSIKIEFEFLEEIFDRKDDDNFEEILNYLSEKGWLNSIDNGYKLSQITKEYIWTNYLSSFEEIEKIVNFFHNSKAKNLKNNIVYIESINSFLERIGKIDEFSHDNISNMDCDLCSTALKDETFFIDGKIKNMSGQWGNVCLNCFEEKGIELGKGIGQLYKKIDNEKWLLLAGWDIHFKEINHSNIKFNFLKANSGESIIVSTENTNIIIDGGTARTYQENIRPKVNNMKILDLVVFTHRDTDHIGGLIELIKDKKNREKIKEIWMNEDSLKVNMSHKEIGYGQAILLQDLLIQLNISTRNNVFLSENNINQSYKVNDIQLELLSPIKQGNEYMRGKKDSSIENASSITFILKYQNKKFLFLADAHIEVINYSLKKLGYSKENRLKVDFVKLSHGGSIKNINAEFLDMVSTNRYVILTDGKRFNFPHKETLELILTHELRAESIEFICNYRDVLENKLSEEEVMRYNCKLVYASSM